jgi:acid phosphatase
MVYSVGNWEYSYLYRDAPGALEYSIRKFGVWMLELESHLRAAIAGKSQVRYRHNVAHDGSISSLLGFLQVSKMAWPGM